jgi:hypothetical protein
MNANEVRRAIIDYLGYEPGEGVKLMATKNSVEIDEWNVDRDQPTMQELETIHNDNLLGYKKADKIREIKGSAHEVIISEYPDWKQRNLAHRASELIDKKYGDGLTPEEETEEQALKDIWTWVKSIRTQSDTFEDEVNAIETVEDVENYTWSFI